MGEHIKIRFGVSPSRSNNGDDILQLKQAFEALGYYKAPEYGITPYADNDIFSSILQFQKDMGLKRDKVVNPKGETERTINQQIRISGKSPIIRCPICTAPHGGVNGDVCPDCTKKGAS